MADILLTISSLEMNKHDRYLSAPASQRVLAMNNVINNVFWMEFYDFVSSKTQGTLFCKQPQ